MKLLFVFTGGTIGSTQNGGVIAVDENKAYGIINAYSKRYGINFEYDVLEPYTELSEYNTGWHIRELVGCIKKNADKGYDGIIVAHGSDTLQYSAAAIGYCLGLNSLPVCIVASNSPIEVPSSNALDNLHGAISFITQKGGRGAFVVYRNANSNTVRVHRATRLIGPKAYSDDVSSVGSIVYGWLDGDFNFIKNNEYYERADEISTLDEDFLEEFCNHIIVIAPYPAMIYPQVPDSVKYVILNTYHSGTLNTKSRAMLEFLKQAKSKNVKVYLTGVTGGPQYASCKAFESLGIIPIKDISPVAAYVKLWLISSVNKETQGLMELSLGGDIVK